MMIGVLDRRGRLNDPESDLWRKLGGDRTGDNEVTGHSRQKPVRLYGHAREY
jgi:hypothetical protein